MYDLLQLCVYVLRYSFVLLSPEVFFHRRTIGTCPVTMD